MPGALERDLTRRAAAGIRLDLEPFRALLAALGNPERGLPVVLIAGTNGKGSTAALLDAIARRAGLRVGLTTSPHLERLEERIRVDGREIASDRLASLLDEVFDASARHATPTPTYFEATIAAAFLAFARARVELAIVEVGLGGRLDATNAAEPLLSIVTPVQLDHQALLGSSIPAIAREKAGIFRPGIRALVATQSAEADAALADCAQSIGAPLHRVADEMRLTSASWRGLDGHRLRLESALRTYELELPLAGEHQLVNAATAVRAAELLAPRFPSIDADAITDGVRGVVWPGRLERVELPGGARVLLDAAHNRDGCLALARFLDHLGEPFDLLFGALADKEVAAMLPPLVARARASILTRPDSERALDPERLVALVPHDPSIEVEPSPLRALERALERAVAERRLLVVCGSIVLVGQLRSRLVSPPAIG